MFEGWFDVSQWTSQIHREYFRIKSRMDISAMHISVLMAEEGNGACADCAAEVTSNKRCCLHNLFIASDTVITYPTTILFIPGTFICRCKSRSLPVPEMRQYSVSSLCHDHLYMYTSQLTNRALIDAHSSYVTLYFDAKRGISFHCEEYRIQ